MRVLVFYPGDITEDRGTPLRCRNLTAALQTQPGIEVELCTTNLSSCSRRFRPDVVYGHTHNAVREMLALRTGAKRVVDIHGHVPLEQWEQRGPVRVRAYRLLKQLLMERVRFSRLDGFTVVTENLARWVSPFGKPVELLWAGVDVSRFPAISHKRTNQITVLYSGNFRLYQGVETLVEAMKIVDSRYRLILIGPAGDLHDESLERQGRIEFVGPVRYAEIPQRLANADILVVPRPWSRTAHYGFPSKLPEYMAAGRAIVATDVGEQGKVIRSMSTGVLIPPGSSTELAKALILLQNESLRERLGAAAREFAITHLDWESIARKAVTFFGRL